jgi:hypothetical protein
MIRKTVLPSHRIGSTIALTDHDPSEGRAHDPEDRLTLDEGRGHGCIDSHQPAGRSSLRSEKPLATFESLDCKSSMTVFPNFKDQAINELNRMAYFAFK